MAFNEIDPSKNVLVEIMAKRIFELAVRLTYQLFYALLIIRNTK